MKKIALIIGIMLASIIASAQVFTAHFDDGTYCSMTIIGNDAYFWHGRKHHEKSEAEKVFNRFGCYSYSSNYSDSYSYILLDTVEIVYNRKCSESYIVQDTVYENGFKKLISKTKYRYYICNTVFVGPGRVAGKIDLVVNDSVYYADVVHRNFYGGGRNVVNDGDAVMISGNKAYIKVKGSIKDNWFQTKKPISDKKGMFKDWEYINNFAFDKICVGTHTYNEYELHDNITIMVDNTVQKSCTVYEVDRETYVNCEYEMTYSKDWEK